MMMRAMAQTTQDARPAGFADEGVTIGPWPGSRLSSRPGSGPGGGLVPPAPDRTPVEAVDAAILLSAVLPALHLCLDATGRAWATPVGTVTTEVDGTGDPQGGGRTLNLLLPRETLAPLFPDGWGAREAPTAEPLYSKLALALARQLAEQMARPDPTSAVYAPLLLHTLVVDVLRTARAGQDGASRDRAPLSDRVLRQIEDHIDQHIAESIRTKDLAEIARVSSTSFTRAFKQATGFAPYQFVLERRLQKAQEMVLSTRDSLAQIAFLCGFSSQAHMTDVCRNKLGVTPGQMRRDQSLERPDAAERAGLH
ncbi:MAG: AraC family transcriptional regulator [Pseudomonadota bacterium]